MYRLFIVDDEVAILNGLKKVIDWETLGFEIVGAFSSADSAMQAIRETPPDVILTDIKMPGKDGLTLGAELREQGLSQVKLVYLSGYDDFEYAQKSLRVGAFDYILKPSSPDNIAQVFERLYEVLAREGELASQQESDSALMRSSIALIRKQLLHDSTNENVEGYKSFLQIYHEQVPEKEEQLFCVVSLCSDMVVKGSLVHQADFQAQKQTIETILDDVIQTFSAEDGLFAPYIYTERHFWSTTLVFSGVPITEAEQVVQSLLTRTAEHGILLELGVGEFAQDIKTIKAARENSLCRLVDVPPECGKYLTKLLLKDTLVRALYEQDKEGLYLALWENIEALERFPQQREFLYQLLQHCIYLCLCSLVGEAQAMSYYQYAMDTPIQSSRAKELVEQIFVALNGNTGAEGKNYQMCLSIARFITEHFTENITLEALSQEFYMSPNYLGVLFKKNIGVSVHEYITMVRLNEADELLKNTQYKLYEVAEKVGYHNYEYFRKVYKRNRGKNPSRFYD